MRKSAPESVNKFRHKLLLESELQSKSQCSIFMFKNNVFLLPTDRELSYYFCNDKLEKFTRNVSWLCPSKEGTLWRKSGCCSYLCTSVRLKRTQIQHLSHAFWRQSCWSETALPSPWSYLISFCSWSPLWMRGNCQHKPSHKQLTQLKCQN